MTLAELTQIQKVLLRAGFSNFDVIEATVHVTTPLGRPEVFFATDLREFALYLAEAGALPGPVAYMRWAERGRLRRADPAPERG